MYKGYLFKVRRRRRREKGDDLFGYREMLRSSLIGATLLCILFPYTTQFTNSMFLLIHSSIPQDQTSIEREVPPSISTSSFLPPFSSSFHLLHLPFICPSSALHLPEHSSSTPTIHLIPSQFPQPKIKDHPREAEQQSQLLLETSDSFHLLNAAPNV